MTTAAPVLPAPPAASLEAHIVRALAAAELKVQPYRHWLLTDVLPEDLAFAVTRMPFAVPEVGDTEGRRETHNASRVFASPAECTRTPPLAQLAETFQQPETVRALGQLCRTDLAGTFLRLEYCQDTDGFWLEPHTDIRVKKFTMLVYLSRHPDADDWGTDVYDGRLERVARASGGFNRGLIFVPADDTWHGFERRPIRGVRRSLIVNYVGPEWRARDELAFPDRPVD